MKKIFLATLLVISTSVLMAQTTTDNKTNTGIKTEKRDLGSFSKVKAGKGINVTLVEGDKEMVEVQIQNGATSDVITTLEGQTLVLKMKTRIYKDMAVRVYVTYKKLIEINAGTGSGIDCDGAVIADNINLIAETDASIEIELYAKRVYSTLSASRIELSGSTDYQDVKAYAGARYNAGDFESKEAFIKTNTGGIVTVNVSEKLTGSAATGAQVYYYGTPAKLEKTESVGGKIQPAVSDK